MPPPTSLRSLPLGDFLNSIAAKTPAPGGGAVASATAALAASLGQMVVAFSLGKKSLAPHQPALSRAAAILARTSTLLLELADEDAAAYTLVNQLSKLPESDPHRIKEWPAAVQAAVNIPRAVIGASCDLLRLLESLHPITNTHLHSDLAIAAILAESAARSAWWNVKANLPLLPTPESRATLEQELQSLLQQAQARLHRLELACS